MLMHVTGVPHHPEEFNLLCFAISVAHVALWMGYARLRAKLGLKNKQTEINVNK